MDSITKNAYISNDIRSKIMDTKELKPNQMLPTETELCQKYGVSKMTLKKALDVLVEEGLIYKKRGVGTFVKNMSDAPMSNIVNSNENLNLSGFSNTHKGKQVNTRVLEYTIVPADQFLAEKLTIQPEDFVYQIQRVRAMEGKPWVHECTYMPIDIIPGLKRAHVEVSIYDYIEKELMRSVQSAHVVIKARKCPQEIARHLELEEGEPIMQVTQIAFLDNGQIFEYSITSHRYDTYEFHNVIVKRNS